MELDQNVTFIYIYIFIYTYLYIYTYLIYLTQCGVKCVLEKA